MTLIQFDDFKKQKEYKKSVVMNVLIDYYKSIQEATDVNIPYFLRARDMYNELIHSNKDLNEYYRKVVLYGYN